MALRYINRNIYIGPASKRSKYVTNSGVVLFCLLFVPLVEFANCLIQYKWAEQ